jgi:hypothetical protein
MVSAQEAFIYTGQSVSEIPPDLTHVKVDPSIKVIGMKTFWPCKLLRGIDLPEGLECIEPFAFYACISLEGIAIPSTVKVIGKSTFNGCRLRGIDLREGLECINKEAFRLCDSLEGIVIPGTVKVIGEKAFYCCKRMRSVELREGLEEIHKKAFSHCRIQRISIPSTVKYIATDAFEYNSCVGCLEKIESIEFSSSMETFLSEVSLRHWLVIDKTMLFEKYNMLAQRSIPKRFEMMMLVSGKMHIRDMLSRIPSVFSQDLPLHFDSIELKLDHYLELQECVMESLDNAGIGFITPHVLSCL